MKVKDVLIAAAECMGRREIADYLQSGGTNAELDRDVVTMQRCFRIVENEVAVDYLPLKVEAEVTSEDGVIELKQLDELFVSVLSVKDTYGNPCAYKLMGDWLKTRAGEVKIVYTKAPKDKTMDEECEVQGKISERLLAYGVACEYSLTVGAFDEAIVWDTRYKDALKSACVSRPCARIKGRRWV